MLVAAGGDVGVLVADAEVGVLVADPEVGVLDRVGVGVRCVDGQQCPGLWEQFVAVWHLWDHYIGLD